MSGDNFLSEMLNDNSSVGVCGIKKLTTMYKTFNNYYNHEKYAEYVPMAVVMFLISNFMLFDDVTLNNCVFIKNIPDVILFLYCGVYYNINSWLGRSMTKFLLLLRFISVTLTYILPYHKIISLLCYVLSMLFLTVGYHKLTNKSYNQLIELKYNNLYLGPFYAYIFYERNYNLEKKLQQTIQIIINYIKKFSTSDIIKQYNYCIQDSNLESQSSTIHPDEPPKGLSDKQDEEQLEETNTESADTSTYENDDAIKESINNEENECVATNETDNKEIESLLTEFTEEYEGVQTRSKTSKKEV